MPAPAVQLGQLEAMAEANGIALSIWPPSLPHAAGFPAISRLISATRFTTAPIGLAAPRPPQSS
jgi:hypothetical protein